MNKTIYLRDGDELVWERAKRIAELTQGNISTVIVAALRRYVAKNEGVASKMEALLKGRA